VPFQEFRLMSSALNGWRYDVMKFDSRKSIDISTWQAPIKLNRKEPRRDDGDGGAPVAVGPMLGADGKPVIGPDGKVVMVDAEGRPIHAGGGGGGSEDGRGRFGVNGRKKFMKKTRQVFLVPEATRQLRKEERYPWVMEDASQKEVWVGKLAEVSMSENHAFFMPAANDIFKFVPAHRWYKFQKKPNYHIPSLEEAESIVSGNPEYICWDDTKQRLPLDGEASEK
jgi:transcription initiation factor TFIIF subunit alpha